MVNPENICFKNKNYTAKKFLHEMNSTRYNASCRKYINYKKKCKTCKKYKKLFDNSVSKILKNTNYKNEKEDKLIQSSKRKCEKCYNNIKKTTCNLKDYLYYQKPLVKFGKCDA